MPNIENLPTDSTVTGDEAVPAVESGVARKITLSVIYAWIINSFVASSTWSALLTLIDGKASSTHTHGAATTAAAGLMSAADKAKLDGIEAGAQVNTVTSVNGKTGPVTITTGVISGTAESISGIIETAADKSYILDLSANYAYSVDSLNIVCGAGSCTAKLTIDDADITGITGVAVGTSVVSADATAQNAVAVNGKLKLVISGNSAALDVSYTIATTRT